MEYKISAHLTTESMVNDAFITMCSGRNFHSIDKPIITHLRRIMREFRAVRMYKYTNLKW